MALYDASGEKKKGRDENLSKFVEPSSGGYSRFASHTTWELVAGDE